MIELAPGEANCGLCSRKQHNGCSVRSDTEHARRVVLERHDCSGFRPISLQQLNKRLVSPVDQGSLF